MNFFRKRARRILSTDTTSDDKQIDGTQSRRHSYFSMRRRNANTPVAVTKLSSGSDEDTSKKSMRRRSIPGIAYLVSRRSSVQLADSSESGTDVAEREPAVRRSISLGRASNSKRGRAARTSSDCDSSSDDSDDTLTTKDQAAHSGSAQAESAGRDPPTIGSMSGVPGTSIRDCAVSARASMDISKRTSFFLNSTALPPRARPAAERVLIRQPRSTPADPAKAPGRSSTNAPSPTVDNSRLLHSTTTVLTAPRRQQQRRQQLSLNRMRAHTSTSTLTSAMRSTLFSLTAAQSIRGDSKPLSVRVQKKRSAGGLGKLSLTPQPTAAEQARMDAWTADDDEFSATDYDLSGAFFELPPTAPASLAMPGTDLTAYSGISKTLKPAPLEIKSKQTSSSSGNTCGTPGSRLSSTSTVVEECTLSPEQYRRIYNSSAHKLQWPGKSRDMSCMVHIKNIMAKASECFVVVSGGRHLDPSKMARSVLAGLYDSEALPNRLLGAAVDGPYPQRSRSVACLQQLLQRPRQQNSSVMLPARRRSLDDSQMVQAMAAERELLYDSELLGANAGDLVDPAYAASSGGDMQAYRRFRHRKAGRRTSGYFQAASVMVMV
ncbi:hypothetical protein IWW36_001489 [Coemansia brasiliensis]|uniref:Uncharacterized protein n=1 Tax=Coemansia brasiliensis TaxID=2650707 RepID=A0A9W8IGM9_9FUNG|nr:hypothetical protein IWW36_001489 [Coemansia brasiliensis]